MKPLTSLTVAALLGTALTLMSCTSQARVEGAPPTPEALAAKGTAAAAQFPGLGGLCDLSMVFRDVNAARPEGAGAEGRSRPTQGRARPTREDQSPVPPMKVFDNLYFVGDRGVAAWVLGSEADGYILIDALTSNDAAKAEIEGGMRTLGLDPGKIRYLLITHAHGDHFGGHSYISATFKPRVVMSEADWALAGRLSTHPRFGAPPPRDMTVKDGDRLTLGKTTLEIHVTPGHTPGTISPIFTVYDQGKPFRAALWGGTGFNFGPDLAQMKVYAQSALDYKAIAARENVSVFLSNHPSRDGSLDKMERLAGRSAGQPNPFVLGTDSLKAFDVLHYCAAAQAQRLASGSYGANQ